MEFISQKDLMILARERNLKGRSKMRKNDLMKALHDDELERRRERKAWREENKRRKAEEKAERNKERKEVKRGRKEDREKKLMRTKSEIKDSKREKAERKKQGRTMKVRHEDEERKTKGPRQTKRQKNKERKEREIIDSEMKLKPHAKQRHKNKVKMRSTLSRPSPPQDWSPEVIQSKSSLKSFAKGSLSSRFTLLIMSLSEETPTFPFQKHSQERKR